MSRVNSQDREISFLKRRIEYQRKNLEIDRLRAQLATLDRKHKSNKNKLAAPKRSARKARLSKITSKFKRKRG